MAVAGAVVVPLRIEFTEKVIQKLKNISADGLELTVEGAGPSGIAVVLHSHSTDTLEKISRTIQNWDEVVSFDVVYVNWEEDIKNKPSGR